MQKHFIHWYVFSRLADSLWKYSRISKARKLLSPENMFETVVELMSVNHSARSGGIIGISLQFSIL